MVSSTVSSIANTGIKTTPVLPGPVKPPAIHTEKTVQQQQLELIVEQTKLIKWKFGILEQLHTKEVVARIGELETEFTKLQAEELAYRNNNRGFMAGLMDDCQVVKEKLAELFLETPEFRADAKKATVQDKDAWMRTQRTQNKELLALINKQAQVYAAVEDYRLRSDATKRKLEIQLALLRMKTAQTEFLAKGI